MQTKRNEHVKAGTCRIGLVFFLAVASVPAHLGVAFAAPPAKADPCTKAVTQVAAAWPDLLRKIDKRTVDEAANAATAGSLAFKTGQTLLVTLAKHARASGNEDDLAIAQVVDAAVVELKVVAPTTAAIAAWAKANQACDQVKLLTGEDPNSVCESAGLNAKVQGACKSCDRATATMQALAAGTPAGEHTFEGLTQEASEHADSAINGLAEGGVTDRSQAKALASALVKHLNAVKASLKDALESSSAGGVAWEVHDMFGGGTEGHLLRFRRTVRLTDRVTTKLSNLPGWTNAPMLARALATECKAKEGARVRKAVNEAPKDCTEDCRKAGECVPGWIYPERRIYPICQAKSDVRCAASEACREEGRCKAVDNVCRATRDVHCAESVICQDTGRCKAVDGSCRKSAATAEECQGWAGCQQGGECSLRNGVCVVGGPDDCRQSAPCREAGRCSLDVPGVTGNPNLSPQQAQEKTARTSPVKFRCSALSRSDCQQSSACSQQGYCSPFAGHCQVGSDSDCQRSDGCAKHARCSRSYGTCGVTSDQDCQMSALCTEKGACRYYAGSHCCVSGLFGIPVCGH